MAAKTVKRNESVIWLPPRAVGERAFATEQRLVALVSAPDGQRYARLSLESLPRLRAVTLVVDARDVTLIPAALPPLSGAKLRQAVPNAVEDSLLQDPSTCLFAIARTPLADGRRLVAVIDRSWMEFVVGAFERRGVRVTSVLPAQLALPLEEDAVSVACIGDGLALRTEVAQGLGWSAASEPAERVQALTTALATMLAPPSSRPDLRGATRAGAKTPEATVAKPKSRLIAFNEDDSWSEPVRTVAGRLRLGAELRALPVPQDSPIDLLDGREGSGLQRRLADIDWRQWRLPFALAAACVVAFLGGLNLHWGKLAGERADLRATLEQRFRQVFPANSAMVDPVLQMEQRVAVLRAAAGQTGPDDFVPLVARFTQALGPQATSAVVSLEFRDGRLRVSFVPALVGTRAVRDSMQQSARRLGLDLRFEAGRETAATVGLL